MDRRDKSFDFSMSKGAKGSFQARIAGMALITAISVLLAACAVFILQQWMSERVSTRRQQDAAARFTAEMAGRLALTDPNWAQDVVAPLAKTPNIAGAVVLGLRGERLATYGADPLQAAGVKAAVQASAPITIGGRPGGQIALLSEDPGLGAVVARYASAAAALFFAATGLALFVAKWLAGRVIEPVRRLSLAMEEVAERGDFSQSVERVADDELGALTDTFNRLLQKLDSNDQALRRTMVELVEARDAAEAANVLKSQFLANMSHEIRTPLNGVLAMAQIMALGELSPMQRERLEVVHQSGEALLAVLNDVLDLSKIEAGKMEMEPTEFELVDLARDAEAAFGEVARRKGLDLVVEVRLPDGGRRWGDVARLRQIASNLLSNALKFTDRGAVWLILEIEPQADGSEALRLTVRDTGIGIPADKLPMLFQKFVQVDSSATRRFGGTGLGLAICRELAGLMGGRMYVESREGEGSTFSLVAPLPRAAARPAIAPAAPRPLAMGPHAPRVLAAEDNPANQLVLRTILQTFGAELTLAADGRAAVEAWRAGAFDLVLMDIQMPVMDGVAATRAIRDAEAEAEARGERIRRTPIVALSANAMTHQVKSYLAAGMDMHLAKPLDIAKLLELLRAVGGGRGPGLKDEAA